VFEFDVDEGIAVEHDSSENSETDDRHVVDRISFEFACSERVTETSEVDLVV